MQEVEISSAWFLQKGNHECSWCWIFDHVRLLSPRVKFTLLVASSTLLPRRLVQNSTVLIAVLETRNFDFAFIDEGQHSRRTSWIVKPILSHHGLTRSPVLLAIVTVTNA